MNKKNSILLVEDDHSIRTLMAEILNHEGHHVTAVHNARFAISNLQEKAFDLLITDFRMPHVNGVDLHNWCKRNKILLPIIFMSATRHLHSEEKMALQHFEANLLHKPFNLECFVDMVKKSLAHKELLGFMQLMIC